MPSVMVTGANRGIGLELCRQLHHRGDTVIATCRQASPELDGLGVRVIRDVDVADDASVRALAKHIGNVRLDILINNAAISVPDTLDDLDLEQVRRQFEVNTLGPIRVTLALLPNLKWGSKLVLITSRLGSIGDNGSGGGYGYRISKAGLNMAGVNLAHDLRRHRVAVAILHPGMVATEMTGGDGIPVAESAKGLIARIDGLRLEDSGSFWHANGERLPW